MKEPKLVGLQFAIFDNFIIQVICIIVLSCSGYGIRESFAENRYIPGIYEGAGKGMHGVIVVKVEFDKNAIAHIEITENNETPVISDYAIEKIPAAILNSQSTEVDAVSGATESSEGIKRAVEDAIRKALRK